MSQTPDQVIAYYVGLLIIQYYNKSKAQATINAFVTPVVADLIYTQVENAFDLQSAVGAQLDILADYLGAFRSIPAFVSTVTYFELTAYSSSPVANTGFGLYTSPTDPIDYWIQYTTNAGVFVLTDPLLQQLIQYLAALYALDYTNSDIDALLVNFFGGYVKLTDNGNMTITYTHSHTDPSIFFAIVNSLNKLPRPSGVGISVVQS